MRRDLTLYPYKIEVAQMFTAANNQRRHEVCRDFLHFVQHYHATVDCPWFSNEAHVNIWVR